MLTTDASKYTDIEYSDEVIPQTLLDIGEGRRVNALPWRGQFSPELVEILLHAYSQSGLVLDPFCGSGTTLIEAARFGCPSYGVEVNPAAQILARLYMLGNGNSDARAHALALAEFKIRSKLGRSEDTAALLDQVLQLSDSESRIIAEGVFLLALKNGDTFTTKSLDRAFHLVSKLVNQLPKSCPEISVELGDARAVKLPSASVGMVLTSPPYVNVFNYHQNYRKAVELLGHQVLPAARSELGSNRKHRQNRFLTVIQYAQDIGLALSESVRLVKPGGVSVWVVGRESNVRGSAIPNPRIVYEMAVGTGGLELVGKHQRKFRSRYGALVYEDVLAFRHVPHGGVLCQANDSILRGREVGRSVLKDLSASSAEVGSEICEAIRMADQVLPSPSAFHGMTQD